MHMKRYQLCCVAWCGVVLCVVINCTAIATKQQENVNILEVNLAGNQIGTPGCNALAETVKMSTVSFEFINRNTK